jgi:hypothetical protein
MSNGVYFGRIGLVLFAAIAFPPSAALAKDFVSNPYGFQIALPPGYREQHSDVVNIIAEFVEPQSDTGEAPLTIDIRHTGTNYNPADKAAIPDLPGEKILASTSETRHWRDLELPAVRQETAAASASDRYVVYSIVFPVADEGVNVVVRGQKSREREVARVFDNCVGQFINLKPYVAVTANGQPVDEAHPIERLLSNVLLPVVTSAIVAFWIIRVRKARSKAAAARALPSVVDSHDVQASG